MSRYVHTEVIVFFQWTGALIGKELWPCRSVFEHSKLIRNVDPFWGLIADSSPFNL